MSNSSSSNNTANLWDDSDCTVNDECSGASTVNIPNPTAEFVNTLRSNKGSIQPEDVDDFMLDSQIEVIDSVSDVPNEEEVRFKHVSSKSIIDQKDFDKKDFS